MEMYFRDKLKQSFFFLQISCSFRIFLRSNSRKKKNIILEIIFNENFYFIFNLPIVKIFFIIDTIAFRNVLLFVNNEISDLRT